MLGQNSFGWPAKYLKIQEISSKAHILASLKNSEESTNMELIPLMAMSARALELVVLHFTTVPMIP